jgi:PTH1 family peptidyl-tRNA hydrolase
LFTRKREDEGRWAIVGLGNPGDKYAETRHNAGAKVLDVLTARMGEKLKSHKSGCLIAEGTLGGERAVLARPVSYMNESGRSVRQLMSFYKIPADRLIVVHDELDVPFGEVRVKEGGGAAGHNGLKSVANHLSTKDFLRVRVGVSRPRQQGDAVDHVLSRFSGAERAELPDVLERAADAVEMILEAGVDRAMTDFNARS